MIEKLYFYKAVIKNITDGDTVTLDIKLGFGAALEEQTIRLYGLDTPELRGETAILGAEAKATVEFYLWPGRVVMLESIKNRKQIERREKYGRWLGRIHLLEDGFCLNDLLLEKGIARAY